MSIAVFKPSTTSTTTTTAAAIPFDISSLCKEILGFVPSRRILGQMAYYVRLMGLDVLEEAMCETATAPHPSIRYLLAILSRCDREGVRNIDDYIARQTRFHERTSDLLPF